MKLRILITFIFFSNSLFANSIDSINSNKDVLAFLSRFPQIKRFLPENDSFYPFLTDSIKNTFFCTEPFNKIKPKDWEKTDLNNDGNTDLIVNLISETFIVPIIVIDNGNNSFKILYSGALPTETCPLIKTYTSKRHTLIVSNRTVYQKGKEKKLEIDTLVYLLDDLIEFYNHPLNSKVISIQLRTSGCYGKCPIFILTFKINGSMEYIGIKNVPRTGKYFGKVTGEQKDSILRLINYIDFKMLKNNYDIPVTDAAKYRLKIKFSNGTSKEIEDYPGLGTRGLQKLYSLFFDLYSKTPWK